MLRMTRTRDGREIETRTFDDAAQARRVMDAEYGVPANGWHEGNGELFHCAGTERYSLSEVAVVASSLPTGTRIAHANGRICFVKAEPGVWRVYLRGQYDSDQTDQQIQWWLTYRADKMEVVLP